MECFFTKHSCKILIIALKTKQDFSDKTLTKIQRNKDHKLSCVSWVIQTSQTINESNGGRIGSDFGFNSTDQSIILQTQLKPLQVSGCSECFYIQCGKSNHGVLL